MTTVDESTRLKRGATDNETESDRYMRPGEAANFLGITNGTLWRWRKAGEGPPAYAIPGLRTKHGTPMYRYRRSELIAFMQSELVNSDDNDEKDTI